MGKHYTLKEKKARNERLCLFCEKHPGMTLRAIGNIFHLSHVQVYQILKRHGVGK